MSIRKRVVTMPIYLEKRTCFILFISCVFLVIGLLLVVALNMKTVLVYESPSIPDQVDAVVVLAGGTGNRVQKAVSVLKHYRPHYLIMTGSPLYHISTPRLMGDYAKKLQADLPLIIYEEQSYSTYDHIKYLPAIFDRYQIRKVLVVTSYYHTARTYLMFNRYIKKFDLDYDIYVLGSEDNVSYSHWWKDHEMIERVGLELIKRLYYFLLLP
tara:strand:+ start:10185 stop:10820 length:636 start_codon:yes stop_codon:yes gene_type:complete